MEAPKPSTESVNQKAKSDTERKIAFKKEFCEKLKKVSIIYKKILIKS